MMTISVTQKCEKQTLEVTSEHSGNPIKKTFHGTLLIEGYEWGGETFAAYKKRDETLIVHRESDESAIEEFESFKSLAESSLPPEFIAEVAAELGEEYEIEI